MHRPGSTSGGLLDGRDHFLGSVAQVFRGEDRQAGLLQYLFAEIDVRAFEADDQRHVQIDLAGGGDDALGDDIAAHDTAKDVDQHAFDVRVAEDQFEGGRHPVARRPAADVEKIGRVAAMQFDDVHRRHRQPRAVDHAADVAFELDVIESMLAGLDIGMAEESVVVKPHLGVERQELARTRDYQRVDLGDRGVELAKGLVEGGDELDRDTDLRPLQPEPVGDLARMEGLDPARWVDRDFEDLFRRPRRNLLDLYPALGRADQGHAPGVAVDQQAEIQLTRDIAALLDI